MLISEVYHHRPVTIKKDATAREALWKLLDKKINGLVVVDDKKRVLGILSLQDIAAATVPRQFRKNIAMAAAMYRKGFFSEQSKSIQDKLVSEIMRKDFVSVSLHENIMAVTADFLKNDLYIVPVVDKKKLVGIVTRSEIKHALAYGMRLPSRYWHEEKDIVKK